MNFCEAENEISNVVNYKYIILTMHNLCEELDAVGDRLEEAFTKNFSSAERSEMIALLKKMLKKG